MIDGLKIVVISQFLLLWTTFHYYQKFLNFFSINYHFLFISIALFLIICYLIGLIQKNIGFFCKKWVKYYYLLKLEEYSNKPEIALKSLDKKHGDFLDLIDSNHKTRPTHDNVLII